MTGSEARDAEITLTSPAFEQGRPIPPLYTCEGEDVSPPLRWSGGPTAHRSLALVCDDPDAPRGTWDHWVLYNLPGQAAELAQGVPKVPELPSGARHGRNSWGKLGYGGPCPPPGKPHRYFFRLYALDIMLNLAPGASKAELEHAMTDHILGQGMLMGTYQRGSGKAGK
jgi:Raf kinase inhibitor-like YbhB/YbcL family protein